MNLPVRDRSVLLHLDYFKQLTTSQIRRAVFADSASRTSCDRTLERLMRDGYVARIEKHRPVGGGRGGSGQYVWALDTAGWRMTGNAGRLRRQGAVNYHHLGIAELYIKLKEAEREGSLKMLGFMREEDAWLKYRDIELEPDALTELQVGNGRIRTYWLELDMGTQRPARLNEKMDRYWRMFESLHDGHEKLERFHGGKFPLVVFVAHDDDRRREIAWLIERRKDDAPLFRAVSVDGFPFELA